GQIKQSTVTRLNSRHAASGSAHHNDGTVLQYGGVPTYRQDSTNRSLRDYNLRREASAVCSSL
ncbi:hypothetical protein J6590_036168, partial [Homalodisca vitripennis]